MLDYIDPVVGLPLAGLLVVVLIIVELAARKHDDAA